jgi:zinc D-Ala-D-Ala carboxypeptidase
MMDSKYFTAKEMRCQETGEQGMQQVFIDLLDVIREECGFPFVVTSGYRSPGHSLEKRKEKAGSHTMGCAVDIRANSKQKAKIMEVAKKYGVTRFGINKAFIHLDIADRYNDRFPANVVWAY